MREVGLVDTFTTSSRPSSLTKNGTPLRVKDIAVVSQGPKIRGSASSPAQFTAKTARSSTTMTWSQASCCCAKALPPILR